ncbi:MAG: CusA/CzcA family heavy metal efflux RND transporter [Candidatus Marinimicrobia bacterium]|nr:CusA/CzcA family heavy metal efflux RND transporter [Candidatus Neomarinimicrobiota bacterium]
MINKLLDMSLKNRLLVILLLVAIIVFGVVKYNELPVDAFPDTSPIMVPVFVEGHGMAPEEIERLITFPIESAMNGLPGIRQIKSTSAFGMAVIYMYFEDNIDIYFARQIVAERLSSVQSELPDMDEMPTLGPISTGLGQIFMYYLTADSTVDTQGKDKNTYLREINDWQVKFQLQTVKGVTEILSMGGHVLQYQIKIDSYQLQKYDIRLDEIIDAVNNNNRNAGGQFFVLGSEEYLVRGIGLVENIDDISDIQIKVVNGVPIKISHVAEVNFGNEIRRGVVTKDGEEEVVAGLVLQLFGENASTVIPRLYDKIPEVQSSLPKGVKLVPYYEQQELVDNAIGTVTSALLIGTILVMLLLVLFLGNIRTAFIVGISLPICALIAVIFMGLSGISANLMSLGGIAIAIGMLGDGSIVMVENIYRHLSLPKNTHGNKISIIRSAAGEVAKPIIFSVAIIIIVFLPIFSFQGIEGKMFRPMAFSISFALLGSLLTAIIAAPVLSSLMLKTGPIKELKFLVVIKRVYKYLLEKVLKHKKVFVASVILVFIASLTFIPSLGTEFIPTLEEGSITIGVTMAPSISLLKATETIMNLEKEIVKYDAVHETVSRIGRPEAGSHPHPVNTAEIHVDLNPVNEWSQFDNKAELVEALNEKLSIYPGIQLNFTQPIQNAFDELLSGVKAQLAIKLYGDDLEILREKATEIEKSIDAVPGLVDLSVEKSFGQPQVKIIADRYACSRYGVNVSDLLEIVELAIGGEVIDQIYLGTRRFGIHMRYQEEYRNDPETVKNIMVHTSDGSNVPLGQIAKVEKVIGPIQINRENNQRRWVIQGNVRGRDLGSVVADIQKIVKEKVDLPTGYYLEYGGQFENQQRAMKRLAIIVPLALLLIALMLYLTFRSFKNTILILINIPLALIGGIFGLLISGEYLSVPASVGFIALFGIAVQNGIVLVSYINQLRQEGTPLNEAIVQGGLLRLRPVLMTAFTTILGLLPLLLSQGIGSEVQRPLAVVVISGLFTSTLLTLFVIPALYSGFSDKKEVNLKQQ